MYFGAPGRGFDSTDEISEIFLGVRSPSRKAGRPNRNLAVTRVAEGPSPTPRRVKAPTFPIVCRVCVREDVKSRRFYLYRNIKKYEVFIVHKKLVFL